MTDAPYDFNTYFRLIQSFFALAFHGIAVYFFVGTAKRVFQSSYGDMSPLLRTFLVLWIVEGILSFPYSVTIPLWWFPSLRAVLTEEWYYWVGSNVQIC